MRAGRRSRVVLAGLLTSVTLATGLAACGGSKSQPSASDTLNVIGGSELKDMVPIPQDAQSRIRIKVNLTYTGSLDGADKIASGDPDADAASFVFAVLFGEGDSSELQQIADATGGQVFDARNTPLSEVFKDIRGYQ